MDNTEINDSYDDYSDDFDSGIDSADDVGSINEQQETADTVDLVAKLISGEDISDEETAAAKSRNRGRETMSRSVDSSGRPDYNTDTLADRERGDSEQKQQHVYSSQIQEMADTAQSEWNAAHKEAERLQELFESGQLSAEDHHRLSYEQGQRAAAAKEMAYQTRIHELEHGNAMETNRKMLETELGEDFSADKMTSTMQDMIEFARKNGISDDVLRGVETVEEAGFIYNAMKNESELQKAKLELKAARQMLKKQNAQLKGRRAKQHKDASVGQKNRDTIDQVADLLAELGHGRTR